jgi:hypothetical protein
MLASALIIGLSLILLVYWFRYSCLMLLQNQEERAEASSRADFETAPLDALRRALDRDYQVLTYLLEHAAGIELDRIEQRLMLLDYKLMQWGYRLTCTLAPRQARKALREMAAVLDALNRRMNHQAASRACA